MPSKIYALEPGAPKRLKISRDFFWKRVIVELDDTLIGTITQEELREGRSFRLPDKTTLHIGLKLAFPDGAVLHILRDGIPVPGSDTDPHRRLRRTLRWVKGISAIQILDALLFAVLNILEPYRTIIEVVVVGGVEFDGDLVLPPVNWVIAGLCRIVGLTLALATIGFLAKQEPMVAIAMSIVSLTFITIYLIYFEEAAGVSGAVERGTFYGFALLGLLCLDILCSSGLTLLFGGYVFGILVQGLKAARSIAMQGTLTLHKPDRA